MQLHRQRTAFRRHNSWLCNGNTQMHQLMCEANDEDIYMTWIYVMPDGATEEDFMDIAMDDEQYNECFDLFVKLIVKKGNRW